MLDLNQTEKWHIVQYGVVVNLEGERIMRYVRIRSNAFGCTYILSNMYGYLKLEYLQNC